MLRPAAVTSVPVPVPEGAPDAEDMAALRGLSRLLPAAPGSVPARSMAAAVAHEGGGGNGDEGA